MRPWNDLVGQRLALVLSWKGSSGEDERGFFFGHLGRWQGGLSFSRPGVDLALPDAWLPRIRATPPDLAKAVEMAAYVLELSITEVPPRFSLQELINQGW